MWEMLLGAITQSPGEVDLLAEYHIIEHLNEMCDDKKIKTTYFGPELRKIVYAAVSLRYLSSFTLRTIY